MRTEGLFIVLSQRPYSIRTRIKTAGGVSYKTSADIVRDHIPLEQGLRQSILIANAIDLSCQRPYSIRTRIKTRRGTSCLSPGSQRPYSIRTRIKTGAAGR